ncbi:MAG: hypothetical protein DCC67_17030 [Planctomycetota bacterium]|nr:MAG: hypothetical protein DCC67_17030 [Planctomycetota bacterium]
MKRVQLLVMLLGVLSVSQASATVFINEIDYDNPSTDNAEWVELAGHAGLSLNGYELVFYNGAVTTADDYLTVDLADANFTFSNEVNGWGFFVMGIVDPAFGTTADFLPDGWTQNMIQNGAPDAVQLRLKSPVTNIHLVEYEGDTSLAGDQQTTLDDNNDHLKTSLFLTGAGDNFSDFTLAVTAHSGTPGATNAGQTLAAVPEASSVLLVGMVAAAASALALRQRFMADRVQSP